MLVYLILLARVMFAIGLGILAMLVFRVFLDVKNGRW